MIYIAVLCCVVLCCVVLCCVVLCCVVLCCVVLCCVDVCCVVLCCVVFTIISPVLQSEAAASGFIVSQLKEQLESTNEQLQVGNFFL